MFDSKNAPNNDQLKQAGQNIGRSWKSLIMLLVKSSFDIIRFIMIKKQHLIVIRLRKRTIGRTWKIPNNAFKKASKIDQLDEIVVRNGGFFVFILGHTWERLREVS